MKIIKKFSLYTRSENMRLEKNKFGFNGLTRSCMNGNKEFKIHKNILKTFKDSFKTCLFQTNIKQLDLRNNKINGPEDLAIYEIHWIQM